MKLRFLSEKESLEFPLVAADISFIEQKQFMKTLCWALGVGLTTY
jgi:hypothetical protein